jgi:signal transduction histidine kinase
MSTSTASAPKDAPAASARLESNRAEIEIADDGPGMPIALRDRNLTTKDVGRGTGLGLSPARNIIVGRHGGSPDGRRARGSHDVPRAHLGVA